MSVLEFKIPETILTTEEKTPKTPLTNSQILICTLPTIGFFIFQFLDIKGLFFLAATAWLSATIGLYLYFQSKQNPKPANEPLKRRVNHIIPAEDLIFNDRGIQYIKHSRPPLEIDIRWDNLTEIVIGSFESKAIYSGDKIFDFKDIISKDAYNNRNKIIDFLKNQGTLVEWVEEVHRMGEYEGLHHFSVKKL